MSRTKCRSGIRGSIHQVLTLLFVVLYICGSSNRELLHGLFHSDNVVVTHTEQQEKDPCHRTIYHFDTAQECDHDSHLFAPDKCSMCDVALYHEHILMPEAELEVTEFPSCHFENYKVSTDSYFAVISSSRAPPALRDFF